jgi:hypothetical protein
MPPKPTKQKRGGSPKLQLATSKGILKQRTLLESSKLKKPGNNPPITAMDVDNNDWPLLNALTDDTYIPKSKHIFVILLTVVSNES